MLITSPINPNLKYARRVREGKEPEAIFVEGERLCEECLQSKIPLIAAFYTSELSARAQSLLDQLKQQNCPIYETASEAFEVVSDTVNPQGIILIAARPRSELAPVLDQKGKIWIAFDAVQDPGNVGTILRTAEAAGVQGAIALTGTVDCFAPKTLRSAMGASFRLPIVTDVEIENLVEACRERRITIAGTTANAPLIYSEYNWQEPTLVVLGNEAQGIRPQMMNVCDVKMTIPLHPPVESINVSAAAAAILFEAARQRSSKLSA